MHVYGAAQSHWLRCCLWYFAAGNQSFVTRIMYIYSREEMAALNALYKSGDGFGSRNIMPAAGRDTCKLTAGLLHQEVTVPSTTRLMNSITARGSVSASATALLLCIPPLMKLSKMRTTPLGLLGLLQALLQFHVLSLVQTRSQSTAVPCRWGRHSRTTGLP